MTVAMIELRARLNRGGGTSISRKLAKDILTIFRCIRGKASPPRSLLKNGNCSSQYLAKSHSAVANCTSKTAVVTGNIQSTQPPEASSSMPHQQGYLPNSGHNTIPLRNAAVLKEMHIIREDMTSLKNNMTDLQWEIYREDPPPQHLPYMCHI